MMEDLLRHLLELHLGIRHNFAKHHKVQLMEGCIASVCEEGSIGIVQGVYG